MAHFKQKKNLGPLQRKEELLKDTKWMIKSFLKLSSKQLRIQWRS